MRIPRDVSGDDLIQALSKIGYSIVRQTGSHVRLAKPTDGQHSITVPKTRALKVGTLSSILRDVAGHMGIGKDDLLRLLWDG